MTRFFNTTGPCHPQKHYMLPTEPRLPEVRPLIDKELYFVLQALLIFDRRATAGPLAERSQTSELEDRGRRIRLLRL